MLKRWPMWQSIDLDQSFSGQPVSFLSNALPTIRILIGSGIRCKFVFTMPTVNVVALE